MTPLPDVITVGGAAGSIVGAAVEGVLAPRRAALTTRARGRLTTWGP